MTFSPITQHRKNGTFSILPCQSVVDDDGNYIWEPLPDYGTLMTTDDFMSACLTNGFIDYDGVGQYASSSAMYSRTIYPSEIVEHIKIAGLTKKEMLLHVADKFGHKSSRDFFNEKLKDEKKVEPFYRNFTHVVWFNR
jgi:hypothetical protein